MKEITKLMINRYKIKEFGHDFMGYGLQKGDIYTFHHLITPARLGGQYTIDNGAILCGNTSHPYLHLIENKDYELFLAISYEMVKENRQGYLSQNNIDFIEDCLKYFEREHCSDRNQKGKLLIKEEYLRR